MCVFVWPRCFSSPLACLVEFPSTTLSATHDSAVTTSTSHTLLKFPSTAAHDACTHLFVAMAGWHQCKRQPEDLIPTPLLCSDLAAEPHARHKIGDSFELNIIWPMRTRSNVRVIAGVFCFRFYRLAVFVLIIVGFYPILDIAGLYTPFKVLVSLLDWYYWFIGPATPQCFPVFSFPTRWIRE